jgi:uncharacterized phage protein (TIGR02218 family)
MSKTLSIALKNHYAQGSTTISRQWRFVRRDGQVIAITTCARDLLFDGILYRSKDGVNPSAIAAEASAAVNNSEINGTLSDQLITESDMFAGLWDGASVDIFEVNYRDLSMGKLAVGGGTIGDVKVGRSAFTAELRGLTQSLQKVTGRVYTKGCPWKFGDPNTCRFDIESTRVSGTLTSVVDLRDFTDSSRSEVSDYFGAGVITFVDGENAGLSMEIYSFDSGNFVLHLPMPFNVAVGDAYTVTAGCRKRFTEDCRTKFANQVNHGGFDLVPGNDVVVGLGGTEGTDL